MARHAPNIQAVALGPSAAKGRSQPKLAANKTPTRTALAESHKGYPPTSSKTVRDDLPREAEPTSSATAPSAKSQISKSKVAVPVEGAAQELIAAIQKLHKELQEGWAEGALPKPAMLHALSRDADDFVRFAPFFEWLVSKDGQAICEFDDDKNGPLRLADLRKAVGHYYGREDLVNQAEEKDVIAKAQEMISLPHEAKHMRVMLQTLGNIVRKSEFQLAMAKMEKRYCNEFDPDTDEYALAHMILFKEYTELFEGYMVRFFKAQKSEKLNFKTLCTYLENPKMIQFLSHENKIAIKEALAFGDFMQFAERMKHRCRQERNSVDPHRKRKEGDLAVDPLVNLEPVMKAIADVHAGAGWSNLVRESDEAFGTEDHAAQCFDFQADTKTLTDEADGLSAICTSIRLDLSTRCAALMMSRLGEPREIFRYTDVRVLRDYGPWDKIMEILLHTSKVVKEKCKYPETVAVRMTILEDWPNPGEYAYRIAPFDLARNVPVREIAPIKMRLGVILRVPNRPGQCRLMSMDDARLASAPRWSVGLLLSRTVKVVMAQMVAKFKETTLYFMWSRRDGDLPRSVDSVLSATQDGTHVASEGVEDSSAERPSAENDGQTPRSLLGAAVVQQSKGGVLRRQATEKVSLLKALLGVSKDELLPRSESTKQRVSSSLAPAEQFNTNIEPFSAATARRKRSSSARASAADVPASSSLPDAITADLGRNPPLTALHKEANPHEEAAVPQTRSAVAQAQGVAPREANSPARRVKREGAPDKSVAQTTVAAAEEAPARKAVQAKPAKAAPVASPVAASPKQPAKAVTKAKSGSRAKAPAR